MKKVFCVAALLASLCMVVAGCSQSSRVSYNLSQEADNFNDIRQITVMNCIQGDVLFQMTGKMSITADTRPISLKSLWRMKTGSTKSILLGSISIL